MIKLLSNVLLVLGVATSALGAYIVAVTMPFGTTDLSGAMDEQSALLVLLRITTGGSAMLLGGLLVVIIGLALRFGGGKT